MPRRVAFPHWSPMCLLASALWGGCAPELDLGEPEGLLDGVLPATAESPSNRQRKPDVSPPLRGGTTFVSADDAQAVVSDPEGASIFLVDIKARRAMKAVSLPASDEPGRCTEGLGRYHCLVSGSGQVLSLGRDGALRGRQTVCPLPTGIAFHEVGGQPRLEVACASGELITLAARDLRPMAVQRLDNDLRDVVVVKDELWISRFRSTQVIRLSASREPRGGFQMAGYSRGVDREYKPQLAWRLLPTPRADAAYILFQQHSLAVLPPNVWSPCAGGRGCDPPIAPFGALVAADGSVANSAALPSSVVLPIDFAIDRTGKTFAVLAAGNQPHLSVGGGAPVYWGNVSYFSNPEAAALQPLPGLTINNRAIAIAPYGQGGFAIQTRGRRALQLYTPGQTKLVEVLLEETEVPQDLGMEAFHSAAPFQVACASCHAEAGFDGHTWKRTFASTEPRRSIDLRGGLRTTAPFQWDGKHAKLEELIPIDLAGMGVRRDFSMPPRLTEKLLTWIDAQPAPYYYPVWRRDADLASSGQALFNERCMSCHAPDGDARHPIDKSQTVGDMQPLRQVPSLQGVAYRTPLLSDGCARSLQAVLEGSCVEKTVHDLSSMSSAARDGLVAFLRTL